MTKIRLKGLEMDENRVRQMDAQRLEFPEQTFTLVSCMMGTLAHFPQPDAALAEIRRVLVPGGLVLLSNWQPRSTDVDFLTVNTDAHNMYLSERSPELKELVGLLTDAGLAPERQGYAVLLPTGTLRRFVDSSAGEPGGHLDRLAFVEAQIKRLFPRLRGQILVLLARRPM